MTWSQWWDLREGMVASDQETGGVYQLADSSGAIIYIGSTGQMQTRMHQHLDDKENACIKVNASRYRVEYRSDYAAEERRLYDTFVRDYGRPPKCNKARPPG